MKDNLIKIWHNYSRIGIQDNESIEEHRDVLLINKILFCQIIVLVAYLPLEYLVNGWKLIPYTVFLLFLTQITLIFHHYRLFILGKYYLYIITSLFVLVMGLVVGRGVNNHVIYIPITLMAQILFKDNFNRIVVGAIFPIIFFLSQNILFDYVEPLIYVPMENKATISTLFVILAIVVTFLIGFYFQRINKEYESLIQTQSDNLKEKNREISDSINYAKRIQSAILPSSKVLDANLKDYFVLYLPKDIVAGDFYWLEKIPNTNEVLFAAADCTGHGVPGAMLSVVCYNALNRSVRELGLRNPDMILNKTRDIVVSEFDNSEEDVYDGMDISLVKINCDTLKIEWAGANNPIWIINNKELKEIKGDKHPIGRHAEPKLFTNHVLQLEKGTIIYLFTDGYADQFGGFRQAQSDTIIPSLSRNQSDNSSTAVSLSLSKTKKYTYKRLREKLIAISEKPLPEQRMSLESDFGSWKGYNEQIDDICLIGIKL